MHEKLSSYYQGKKVFVTGHTGFKGSWLSACLHLLGAQIKGYALPPEYENGMFNLFQSPPFLESVLAEIRDKDRLEKEIELFQPDYVFHLAAQPLVRRSYKIPAETFAINVVGTANLLESVNYLKKKCTVIVVTTDKVYQNREVDVLYKEDDVLGGYDPYSASKACTELVINSFRDSFFNPLNYYLHQKAIGSARAGNVIGGGDWNKDRIIPDIIRSLQENQVVGVRNPNAVRPWQHVLEPVMGYLLLGGLLNEAPDKHSKAYNFGPLPNDHLTVRQVVEKAIQFWGTGSWKDISEPSQPHEAGLLKLDISLARKELRFEPKLSAENAIKWTVNWYKQPVARQAEFTFQQIKEYLSL